MPSIAITDATPLFGMLALLLPVPTIYSDAAVLHRQKVRTLLHLVSASKAFARPITLDPESSSRQMTFRGAYFGRSFTATATADMVHGVLIEAQTLDGDESGREKIVAALIDPLLSAVRPEQLIVPGPKKFKIRFASTPEAPLPAKACPADPAAQPEQCPHQDGPVVPFPNTELARDLEAVKRFIMGLSSPPKGVFDRPADVIDMVARRPRAVTASSEGLPQIAVAAPAPKKSKRKRSTPPA